MHPYQEKLMTPVGKDVRKEGGGEKGGRCALSKQFGKNGGHVKRGGENST